MIAAGDVEIVLRQLPRAAGLGFGVSELLIDDLFGRGQLRFQEFPQLLWPSGVFKRGPNSAIFASTSF